MTIELDPDLSVTFQHERTQRTRKQRTLGCGLVIEPGTEYVTVVQVCEGDFVSFTMCPACRNNVDHTRRHHRTRG
jgi:hypothetical protein